ncbi:DUF4174 domain-containing protein [uncultured Winogradskyella sp.]|uniref:DUF4174 domain-containing protein n=1 Tax=uncultured Winogradskyella sp. TaxID=395353 RepID=UPI00260ADA7C|nr:DUF4174 domain-containing protein [uncultured Winogradskyella sp.]
MTKSNKTVLIITMLTCFLFFKSYAQNLEMHKWKNRVLIVKTLDANSEKYQDQIKEFKNSTKELIDRKFVLYQIVTKDYVLINYQNNELNHSGKISKKLAEEILNEKANFEIILIGLDGEIKLKQTEVLMKEDLYKIVDSMPMRKNELRRNRTKN